MFSLAYRTCAGGANSVSKMEGGAGGHTSNQYSVLHTEHVLGGQTQFPKWRCWGGFKLSFQNGGGAWGGQTEFPKWRGCLGGAN